MRTRALSLTKETLSELTTAQLDSVAGASGVSCSPALCAPHSDFRECVTGVECLSLVGNCGPQPTGGC